jgi:N-acetylmuramate 1-kinase
MTMTDQRTSEGTDLRLRIDRYLNGQGLAARGPKVVPLTGDASDRRYFRVLFVDGDSIVLALHAGSIDFASLPFANVAGLLQQMPLPVPAMLGHDDLDGIVALEDLGDVTLQAHLGAATATEHAALYREAVALIELLQRRGSELADERYLPYRIAFDVEKLTWELEFFVKHFLEAYRGVTLGNLMLHQGRLHIIDFQDARLGPDTYDLVSLLRDSYVDLTDRELEDLIAYFLALKGNPDPTEFRRRFDLMALQRNLKALGTFGFQTATRGNPVYIQYIPRTLRYVRDNLQKYPRLARLRELLAAHVEELA